MAEFDAAAIRELIALVPSLREAGVAELTVGEMKIVLRPGPSPSQPPPTMLPAPPSVPREMRDDDEEPGDPDPEAEMRRARSAWDAWWSRMLRSSGATIPAFPGVEHALRWVGALGNGVAASEH